MTEPEAIKMLTSIRDYLCAGNPIYDTEAVREALDMAIQRIQSVESVGEWIVDGQEVYGGIEWCHCSVCGNRDSTDSVYTNAEIYPFCARCGARMTGTEKPNNCEQTERSER